MQRFFSFWNGLSISTRLSLWYGLTLMVLLSVFAVFCYVNFHISIHRDFDRHLNYEKRELLPFIRLAGHQPNFENLDQLRSVAFHTDGVYGTFVRLYSSEGVELFRSPNFQNHGELPLAWPDEVGETAVSREWEGKPLRTSYTPLIENATLKGWLEVSGFEWSLHQELHRLGRILVIGTFFGFILAAVGGYLMARRVLRPVAALTVAADQIQTHGLDARLPTNFRVKDELTRLAVTFNRMLDRLDNSFQRERRFTSNAAHELLTPLTTIYNTAEITLRKERSVDGYQDTLKNILVDVDEMTKMVRGLLHLTRAERLKWSTLQRVDLREITAGHIVKYRKLARSKNIDLDASSLEQTFIQGEPVGLGMILDNLLENAIKYTPEGGVVTVHLENQGDSVLRITDSGIGFNEDEAEHLFDRFYRSNQPEIQRQKGSGLGLAIVATIVRNYDGSIRARSEGIGKGSTFELRFPPAG